MVSGPQPLSLLEEALEQMSFRVEPGRYCLFGIPGRPDPSLFEQLAATDGGPPAQIVFEPDETTLLVREELASEIARAHPTASAETDLVWIRFSAPMAWDLVGFLALVCGRLAAAGVPVGAVCGFSRDHLFLAEGYLETARMVLSQVCPEEV